MVSIKFLKLISCIKTDYSFSDQSDYYDNFPFVKVQSAIDTTFINSISPDSSKLPKISMTIQKMPYPPHKNNMYTIVIKQLIPSLTMIGFLTLFMNVLKRVIEEKSTGIKVNIFNIEPISLH